MKKYSSGIAVFAAVVLLLAFAGCDNPGGGDQSSNADLKSLSVSPGSLSPSFSAAVTEYTVTVPAGTTSITVSAEAADTDKAFLSPNSPWEVSLDTNSKNAAFLVTAENGTTKTYTVAITRDPVPEAVRLSALTVGGAPIDGFEPANGGPYTVTVPYTQTTVAISGTAVGSVTVAPVSPVTLEVGPNTVTVTVTSGSSSGVYTINVIRLARPRISLLIEFDPVTEQVIDLTANTDMILSRTRQDSLYLWTNESNPDWEVDGGSGHFENWGDTIWIYAPDYDGGTHSVLLTVVKDDGLSYSKVILFRVAN
jgi:hypothetical protein